MGECMYPGYVCCKEPGTVEASAGYDSKGESIENAYENTVSGNESTTMRQRQQQKKVVQLEFMLLKKQNNKRLQLHINILLKMKWVVLNPEKVLQV